MTRPMLSMCVRILDRHSTVREQSDTCTWISDVTAKSSRMMNQPDPPKQTASFFFMLLGCSFFF
jgi:hypothetical protein